MNNAILPVAERIQTLAAKVLATHSAGHRLYLIGGFRYRLLDASCRTSLDIDYHWEGDLAGKQAEVVEVLRKRLLPEVRRQLGYDGAVRAATGEDADSPAVQSVTMAFYRLTEPGSRIEIPLEITHVPRMDPPSVRTVGGTVYLTLSDADMIESKIIALLNRSFTQARDFLDIFLFADRLPTDASDRLLRKLRGLGWSQADAARRLERLRGNQPVHVRALDRILSEQVDPAAAANLREAGGAAMIWGTVLKLVRAALGRAEELPP